LIVLNDATYTPERWQGTLLTFAAVIFIASFNIFFARNLPLAEGIFACIHVFAFVPVIVCLWYLTPEKQSAAAVFTQFTDNGAGWPSLGATVLVGQVSYCASMSRLYEGPLADMMQVSSMFVVLGSDSVAHMAEEIEDAGAVVPKVSISKGFGGQSSVFDLLARQCLRELYRPSVLGCCPISITYADFETHRPWSGLSY